MGCQVFGIIKKQVVRRSPGLKIKLLAEIELTELFIVLHVVHLRTWNLPCSPVSAPDFSLMQKSPSRTNHTETSAANRCNHCDNLPDSISHET